MAAAPPIGKGYSASQWEAWFTAHSPGVVAGSVVYQGTQLKGKTWAQVYAVIYAYGLSKGTPDLADAAAAATIEYIALDGVAAAAGDAAIDAGDATGAADTGISTASILPSWTNGLTNLLGDLTSKNTWLRVAKVVVGSIMIIVGLVKLTGADKAAAAVAKAA
jgi:hypothetical protein